MEGVLGLQGRGKGGPVVGGLGPRGATLSGDAAGSSELGPYRGQWLQPPAPGETPVQTSADKFGTSVAEVTTSVHVAEISVS